MDTKSIKVENKISAVVGDLKKKFDKNLRSIIEKSISGKNRRAYGRMIKEFLQFQKSNEPAEIKLIDCYSVA